MHGEGCVFSSSIRIFERTMLSLVAAEIVREQPRHGETGVHAAAVCSLVKGTIERPLDVVQAGNVAVLGREEEQLADVSDLPGATQQAQHNRHHRYSRAPVSPAWRFSTQEANKLECVDCRVLCGVWLDL